MVGDGGRRAPQAESDAGVSALPAGRTADGGGPPGEQRLDGHHPVGDVRLPTHGVPAQSRMTCPCKQTKPYQRPSGQEVCANCYGPITWEALPAARF